MSPTQRKPIAFWAYSCVIALMLFGVAGGCGNIPAIAGRTVPRFSTPVSVNGKPVGQAIIDTGGGYDLMLADRLGLEIVETVEILVFRGVVTADVTEPFRYAAGGFEATADTALVGVDLCDCNGIGFFFLRKTGAVLGLDFDRGQAAFTDSMPPGGVSLPFAKAPAVMGDFDTSFIDIELSKDNVNSITVRALIDTGSATTLMQRGILGEPAALDPVTADVFIERPELGTVSVRVGVFDTPGLPDLLIGTDVLRAWSNEWHFMYRRSGGFIKAFPRGVPEIDDVGVTAERPVAKRLPYLVTD